MSACFHLRKERIIKVCKHRIGLVNLSFDVQSHPKTALPINTTVSGFGILQVALGWKETCMYLLCLGFAIWCIILKDKLLLERGLFVLATWFCTANSSNQNLRFQGKVHLAWS